MRTLLLTGSNGLLGQKIVNKILRTKNLRLVATSKGVNRHPVSEGYIYEEMDICNEIEIGRVFEKYQPETVIHTAAMTNVDTCEEQQKLCRKLNVDAVSSLVKAANNFGSHFIHLSTDFVFDGEAGPYDEEAEPNPLSFYGQSKRDAELVVIEQAKNWAILRTIIVYGIANDMSRSNIVLWAKGALEKGEPLNVVNDQWRMPTLAEDLADCCLLAAEKSARGIFNASGRDMLSISDIVAEVADFWKLNKELINPISSNTLNQAAKRPKKTGFILDKTMNELGYRPHSFKEGLQIMDKQLKNAGKQ